MFEPIEITLESLNLSTLTPMLIAIFGGLLILVIDLIKEDLHKSLYVVLSLIFLGLDLGSLLVLELNQRGFFDVILIDGVAILSQIIIIFGSMLFIPLALSSKRYHEYSYPEFFALFLFMVAGFQFMTATDNLILILVGLETASLSLYTLIALRNKDKAFEAAVKYFTMGALSTGFYVFGAMILYGLTGSVEIYKINEVLHIREFEPMILIVTGSLFILASFGFKIALVPFHTWAPDIYEGSSSALVGYMAVIPKVAVFVVLIRLFEMLIGSGVVWLEYAIYGISVLTMTLANIWALVQEDVKRMLAYSSISHAGFIMVAILVGTTQANTAIFLYWAMFLFTILGAFTMLWVSHQKSMTYHNRFDHPFVKFAGMQKMMPVAAILMALFMLSLAGVPPFSLFWGKLYLISSVVNGGYLVLAVIMVLNSAISAYYYLKLIVYMFLKDPEVNHDGSVYMTNASLPLKTILGLSAFFTILSVLMIDPVLEFISYYVAMSGF